MKIVINRDYGGFGLSDEAIREYLRRTYGEGNFQEEEPDKHGFINFLVNGEYFYDNYIERDDLVLVEVIEEMGEKANGKYACLKIVEIPAEVDWYIEEYDGMEHVAEHHRTWC